MYRETWTSTNGNCYMVINETNKRRVTSALTSILYKYTPNSMLEIWSVDKKGNNLGVRTLGKWGI